MHAGGELTAQLPASTAISRFDPLSPAIRAAPHSHYAALNTQPVQALAAHPNFYLISSHDVVSQVLMDPESYDGQPFPGQEVPIMSAMRPEPHKRLRGAIQTLFTNKSLIQLTPHIETQVRLRTDQLLAAGQGDLMELWANPIPLAVIARMFGFPESEDDLVRLHRYGDAAIRLIIPLGGPGLPMPKGLTARWRQLRGVLAALPAALRLMRQLPAHERKSRFNFPNPLAELPGYPRTGFPHHPELARLIIEFQLEVLGIFKDHLKHPRNEVVDALLPPYRNGELSLLEIMSSALQILVAGYETTANTLGAAIHRFALEPSLLKALKSDPSKIDNFIEELLRLDAPLQRTLRRTTRPVTLAGVDLPENAQLILMLGAANLDDKRFACPQQFDINRDNARRHLAFGKGIHMCIGAQLARLETRLALQEILPRIHAVELLPNDPPQRVTDKDIGMWGYSRLPVRITSSKR